MGHLHEDFLDNVEQQELTISDDAVEKNPQDFEWMLPVIYRDSLSNVLQRLFDATPGIKDYKISIGGDKVEIQVRFDADFKTVDQAWRFVCTLTKIIKTTFDTEDYDMIFFRSSNSYSNIIISSRVLMNVINHKYNGDSEKYNRTYKQLMGLLRGLTNYKKDVQVVEYVQNIFELSKSLIYTYQPSTLTPFTIDVRRDIRDLPVHFDVMPESARLIALNCLNAYSDYRENLSSGLAMSFKYTDETLYNALSGKPAKQTMVSFSVRKGYLWYTAYLGVCAWGPEYYLMFLEFNCPDIMSYIHALEAMYQTKLSNKLKKLIKNEYEAARLGVNDDFEL